MNSSYTSFSSSSLSLTSSPGSDPEIHSTTTTGSSSEANGGSTSDLLTVAAGRQADDTLIGVLEVYVHEAREIHNICIYQNQDVYAKVCMNSTPETAISTNIINGGGRNPVFNQKFQLPVQKNDASLKCEVWMMSRVKNYMGDQLLGFVLVPVSSVAGKEVLMQEFSLSSTDLFHSPAGFVQLSLSYSGFSPSVLPATSVVPNSQLGSCEEEDLVDCERNDSVPCEYHNIEFPDPQVVKENERMVSEYLEIACDSLDSEGSQLIDSRSHSQVDSDENNTHLVDSTGHSDVTKRAESVENKNVESKQEEHERVEFKDGVVKMEINAVDQPMCKEGLPKAADAAGFDQPMIKIDVPEEPMIQQQFVDMYMKSMNEFTESLAKMKLPLDIGNGAKGVNGGEASESPSSSTDKKEETPKGAGARVFYGSRAFF